MNSVFLIIPAVMPIAFILIGIIIGTINYKKNGEKIRNSVKEAFANKRAKDGLSSLFHKKPENAVVFRTFGIPIGICFTLALLYILFLFARL